MLPRRLSTLALLTAVLAACSSNAEQPARAPSAGEILKKPEQAAVKDAHFTLTAHLVSSSVALDLTGDGVIVIKPQHYVQEEVVYSLEQTHRVRTETRRAIGKASHQIHVGSRLGLAGAVASILGPLASIPLVARVLFPRLTSQIRRAAASFVQAPPVTRLILERTDATPGPDEGQLGYSLAARAAETELLPTAAEHGVAVIANQPLERGDLFRRVHEYNAKREWREQLTLQAYVHTEADRSLLFAMLLEALQEPDLAEQGRPSARDAHEEPDDGHHR